MRTSSSLRHSRCTLAKLCKTTSRGNTGRTSEQEAHTGLRCCREASSSLLLSLLLSDSFLSLCDIREALKELRNFSLLLLPGRRTRRSTEAFRSLLSVPGKQLSVMTSYHFMHREPSSDGCDENEQFFWGADNDILSPALIYHRREWRASEMQCKAAASD